MLDNRAGGQAPASVSQNIGRTLMLDGFATLAATVTASRAAVICMADRRADAKVSIGSFQATADEISAASAPPNVVDVAGDSAGRVVHRVELMSSGRQLVGVICLFDDAPKCLSEAQAAALELVIDLILADRRRELRHLHQMRVADRFLRQDRLVRMVPEASSCAEALSSVLDELCRHHRALSGCIHQLADDCLVKTSEFAPESDAEQSDFVSDLAQRAIRENEARSAMLPRSGYAVSVPVRLRRQRFAISVVGAETQDQEAVMADLTLLAATIRPALLRKQVEDGVHFVAHHDSLTRLPNRLSFDRELQSALVGADGRVTDVALLCLDLDGFKRVNDSRGHDVGDKLLVAVADRLRRALREGDTVARIGGDEFAIIQRCLEQPAEAGALAARLLEAVQEPFDIDGVLSSIGTSIGIALYPQHGESAAVLRRNADAALYMAKDAGRNTVRFSDAGHSNEADAMQRRSHAALGEQDLFDAIELRQFMLEYQPVRDSASLQIVGFEALLRWSHPSRGVILPDAFIPLAESSGLIVSIGQWVMEQACSEAARWACPCWVSVNLSPLQFRQSDLPSQVSGVLHRSGLSADRLDLEVTEGLLLQDSGIVLRTMQQLQQQGTRITLDDFGTAYASLSYLRRFPFNQLKIDRSFVQSMCDDEATLAIVETVLALSRRLDLTVVAEGVEDDRQLSKLRELGCRLVQGFHVGRPVQHPGRLLSSPTAAHGPPRIRARLAR